jgi:16S rRNA (guanine966-N2)-methyltransferase
MNEVRIIGGMWRRRKIAFPSRPGLRPSPDRTRVTLFNWLAGAVEGRRCLDLFAGSGVLGFEAASRGAIEVVLIERDAATVRALEASRQRLGASTCRIQRSDAPRWLAKAPATPFDIVFLDPPFDGQLLEAALSGLAQRALVSAGGCVYIEHRRGAAPRVGQAWRVVKSTRAGESEAHLLRPAPHAEVPEDVEVCAADS